MRKAVLLGLVALLGVLTISTVAFAGRGKGKGDGNGKNFSTRLNGWEEVPSQVTTGKGSFRSTLTSATRLDFVLNYEGLEGTNVLFAHIHVGSRHENGGVSAFLCGGGGQAACPAGPTGTVTDAVEPANIVAAMPDQGVEAGNFADLLRAIRKGETYVNVHTATRAPTGEVRGQLRKGGKGVGNGDDDDD